jgi:hypothetical protein
MLPKPLKDKLSKLKITHKKKHDVVVKKMEEVVTLKNSIDYLEGLARIKPQILYNYGRDKKYIYGQLYYQVEPQSSKKKTMRFMIGKMEEKKSRKQLENICLDTFYNKIRENL